MNSNSGLSGTFGVVTSIVYRTARPHKVITQKSPVLHWRVGEAWWCEMKLDMKKTRKRKRNVRRIPTRQTRSLALANLSAVSSHSLGLAFAPYSALCCDPLPRN